MTADLAVLTPDDIGVYACLNGTWYRLNTTTLPHSTKLRLNDDYVAVRRDLESREGKREDVLKRIEELNQKLTEFITAQTADNEACRLDRERLDQRIRAITAQPEVETAAER